MRLFAPLKSLNGDLQDLVLNAIGANAVLPVHSSELSDGDWLRSKPCSSGEGEGTVLK
jgi:hypothetical protein